jgi:NADH dehydrogenase
MKRIVVLGGGFAGLWSAVGAARKLDELGISRRQAEVVLIDRNPFHSIRVRNYEADLSETVVAFDDVLLPIGVRRIQAEVESLDYLNQVVLAVDGSRRVTVPYDRLVLALGSQLRRPEIPGLVAHGFNVDVYGSAHQLAAHLNFLGRSDRSMARDTVVVVGAGLTGIEVATALPQRLARAFGQAEGFRIILIDRAASVGSDMGEHARPVIEQALKAAGIETRLGGSLRTIDRSTATLSSGEVIATNTLIWCAGLQSNPLTSLLPGERDCLGRVAVDAFMRVKSAPNMFAAGDISVAMLDPGHRSVMSCQHARPMGRFAGHNVVAHLCDEPMLALGIDWYVTVLDLGSWGAVYTTGWDRQVRAVGAAAKRTKQLINCVRIYPPRNGDRAAILAAAAPVVQAPPDVRSQH